MFERIPAAAGLPLPLLVLTAIAGCTEAPMTEEEIGQDEESVCYSGQGSNSVMAALAVAAARELGRWNPTLDFAPGTAPRRITLSPAGMQRCSSRGHDCWNTQAILDLQKAPPGSVKFGAAVLNSLILGLELWEHWGVQVKCEASTRNCTAEEHELVFKSEATGACDTLFTFDAKSPTGGELVNPAMVSNRLIFAGYPSNPLLSFSSTGSSTGTTVTLDPAYGLIGDRYRSGDFRQEACTVLSQLNLAGQPCSCNGVHGKLAQSTFSPATFLCK